MLPSPVGREAGSGVGAAGYECQQPGQTLLYQLVPEYHPVFNAHMAVQDMALRVSANGNATRLSVTDARLSRNTV